MGMIFAVLQLLPCPVSVLAVLLPNRYKAEGKRVSGVSAGQ